MPVIALLTLCMVSFCYAENLSGAILKGIELSSWRTGANRLTCKITLTYKTSDRITSQAQTLTDQLFDGKGRLHFRGRIVHRRDGKPIDVNAMNIDDESIKQLVSTREVIVGDDHSGHYIEGKDDGYLQYGTAPEHLSKWRNAMVYSIIHGSFLDGRFSGVDAKLIDLRDLAPGAMNINIDDRSAPNSVSYTWTKDGARVSVTLQGPDVSGYEYEMPKIGSKEPLVRVRVSGLEYAEVDGRRVAVRGICVSDEWVVDQDSSSQIDSTIVVAERQNISFNPTPSSSDFTLSAVRDGTRVTLEERINDGLGYEWRGGKPVSVFKEEKAVKLSNYADASVQGFESGWPSWVKRLLLVLLSCGALGVGALLWQRSRAA